MSKLPRKSRKEMVDYITSIGGYYADREWHSIEFTCPAYTDFSLQKVMDAVKSELLSKEAAANPDYMRYVESVVTPLYTEHENDLWEWGQEDVYGDVAQGNDDYYRMLPSTGEVLEVEITFQGRGGKHICIDRFERKYLRMRPEDLEEEMWLQEDQNGNEVAPNVREYRLRKGHTWSVWQYKQIQRLYAMVVKWAEAFTPSKAAAAVEDAGVYCLVFNYIDAALLPYKPEEGGILWL